MSIRDQRLPFSSYRYGATPSFHRRLGKFLLVGLVLFFLSLLLVPWQQSSQGMGTVTAFNPKDRVQSLTALTSGRIGEWFVQEGMEVNKGDPIVEIIDNDPNFLERLTREKEAAIAKFEAANIAAETAMIDFKRQKELFEEGLSSRKTFEKAKINYKKLLAAEAQSAADLAKAENKLARQETQLIVAPMDGTILRLLAGSQSLFIKEGDAVAMFVPESARPAVEIFIDGNDLPLVSPGREVRLQFEGWPAVQFSGWPALAIGTFPGEVALVDPSAGSGGKFRVVVVQPESARWPNPQFLRQGTRAYGWILLEIVPLGWELWRQLNGFPLSLEQPPEQWFSEQKESMGPYEKRKKKEKKAAEKKTKDLYYE